VSSPSSRDHSKLSPSARSRYQRTETPGRANDGDRSRRFLIKLTDIFDLSTGKTMTVECVANDTRRPLLALTAADIGLKEDSEAQLRTWFTLAAKWDAILLIDEADLFLERRREGDIDRNSLVTGMLSLFVALRICTLTRS